MDKLGPTGRFPRGKINEDDEGELAVAIGNEDGKVIIHFATPTAWVGFDPDGALAFAAAIIKHAMALKGRSQ